MFERLAEFFRDQKVLILGFGREGRSTYDFLRRTFPEQEIFIADQNIELLAQNPELTADAHLTYWLGADYLDHFDACDIIMKSPGISLQDVDVENFRAKIKSQLELTLAFANFKTIGVTGTKGKSTTSSLIYQILQDQGVPSILLGNIGTPIFEHLEALSPELIVVLELSSHQLEYVEHSPQIAVLLNVYEEHLDHYRSFRDYALAKCNIFKYQQPQDFLVYNADDETLRELVGQPKSQVVKVSFDREDTPVFQRNGEVYFSDQVIFSADSPRQLIGDYNFRNIVFALAVAKILQLDLNQARATIAEFKTLRHRLELVGEFDGVKYYDNAIGTVPMATIEAVKALGNVDTLIVGGMNRGVDQTPLVEFLKSSNVAHVICMSETGREIAKLLPAAKVSLVGDLAEAVAVAKRVTPPGGICLLSPAAASYGEFKNFEEKGDRFQELVR